MLGTGRTPTFLESRTLGGTLSLDTLQFTEDPCPVFVRNKAPRSNDEYLCMKFRRQSM